MNLPNAKELSRGHRRSAFPSESDDSETESNEEACEAKSETSTFNEELENIKMSTFKNN